MRHFRAAKTEVVVAGVAAIDLIENDAVPDELIPMIHWLALGAGSPSLARRVVFDLLTGRYERAEALNPERAAAFRRTLRALRPEQRTLFTELVTNAVLSSASTDGILAMITRRIVKFGLLRGTRRGASTETAQSVALDLSPRAERCEPILGHAA
jgi:hypothetical protein